MAIFKSEDNRELIITCNCGCDNACHITLDSKLKDENTYAFINYMRNDFYSKKDLTLAVKLKRIWSIIRGRDYYYSDILMTREEWEVFRSWVNEQEV